MTNDEGVLINDEAQMTNDEGNDEARMTNDETMTKSENQNTSADESFWNEDAEWMVREEPVKKRVLRLGRAHSAIR